MTRRSLRGSTSKAVTRAPVATAVRAAAEPTVPAPRITTRAGGTPGSSAEQDAAAAGTGAQQVRGDGDGHLPGDFADRRQHRQAAVVLLDDLAADGGEAPLGEGVQHVACGHGQVVEGHQRRARPAEAESPSAGGRGRLSRPTSARWMTSAGE